MATMADTLRAQGVNLPDESTLPPAPAEYKWLPTYSGWKLGGTPGAPLIGKTPNELIQLQSQGPLPPTPTPQKPVTQTWIYVPSKPKTYYGLGIQLGTVAGWIARGFWPGAFIGALAGGIVGRLIKRR